MSDLQLHPLCTLFPRLDGAEFEALKSDIEKNGQLQPIVVHDGMILDGGNRYRACVELGIEPETVELDFEGHDLLSYVLSVNLHRRHLTQGQHSAIVSLATNWLTASQQGDNRYTKIVTPDWTSAASGPVTFGDDSSSVEKTGNVAGLQTVADRAAQAGVSERTQRMADKVTKADPELAKRVAHGEVTLPQAVKQVTKRQENATEIAVRTEAVAIKPPLRVDAAEESSSENDDEFLAEMNSLRDQVINLNRELDSMRATDVGAEIQKLTQLLINEENKRRDADASLKQRNEDLRKFGVKFDTLRKLLKVETNDAVVSAVRKLAEGGQ